MKIVKSVKNVPLLLALVIAVTACYVTVGGGISVSADTVLTPAQLREIVGDAIPMRYYNGTEYVDTVLNYYTTSTITSVTDTGLGLAPGQAIIVYSANQTVVNQSPEYITVDLQPIYSFFDTESIDMVCGLSSAGSVASAVYSAPQWYWYQAGYGDRVFYNSFDNNGDRRGVTITPYSGGTISCTAVRATMQEQSTFSAYSRRVSFYGNSNTGASAGRGFFFFLTMPVLSDDAVAESGSFVATSGTGGGDIIINVDNSDVVSAIDGLATYPVETAETLVTLPSDVDVAGGMTGADDLLENLPGVVESTGFWLYLLGRFFNMTFSAIPVFQTTALVFVLLSIMMYILWRK